MNQTSSVSDSPATHPVGFLVPTDEFARRAVKAIDEGRWDDALANVVKIGDRSIELKSWKSYLGGVIAARRRQFVEAEAHLFSAAGMAMSLAVAGEDDGSTSAFRLAANAYQELGNLHRRQDHAHSAIELHLAAYRLRSLHGSHDECWETVSSLGLDAYVSRHFEDAIHWYRSAVQRAGALEVDGAERMATSLTDLANSLAEAKQWIEAVKTATSALETYQSLNGGSAACAMVEARLGHILCCFGANLLEKSPETAGKKLDRAIQHLTSASEALEAFGAEHVQSTRETRDRLDFARRLRSSLT